jgi:hypothetical protein
MSKYTLPGILATCLFLILACSAQNGDGELTYIESENDATLSLTKVDTITLDAGDHLFGKFREGLRVDQSGEILSFADDGNQRIYLFDKHGKLINYFGGSGSGPEEFRKISGYFVDQGRLIVVDESQFLAKVFNIDGTLIHSFPLFDNQSIYISSRDIHVEGDILYIQILEADKAQDEKNSKLVARYRLSTGEFLDLVGKYDPFVNESNHYLSMHNFDVDNKNRKLVTSLVLNPRVQVFDLETIELAQNIEFIPQQWNERKKAVEPGMPRQEIMERTTGTSYSTGVFTSESNIYMHFQTLTDAWMKSSDYLSKKNYVAVFNDTGDINYGTAELNGSLGDVHNGQLFVIENFNPDNFTIGIYETDID